MQYLVVFLLCVYLQQTSFTLGPVLFSLGLFVTCVLGSEAFKIPQWLRAE
jgi:hypothetical protein